MTELEEKTDAYLEHFGVKGMKWGVRKNDPSTVGNPAVVAYVGVIAAMQVARMADGGEFIRAKAKAKAFITGEKHTWAKKPELSKPMNTDELMHNVVKQINPGFGKFGTMMNCRRCTMAYEMRRRGLDVEATKSAMATGQNYTGISKATNKQGTKARDRRQAESVWGDLQVKLDINPAVTWAEVAAGHTGPSTSKAIFGKIDTMPDGARGELGVGWFGGGGHSVAWERVNGKTVIFDTQNGTKFESPKDFEGMAGSVRDAAITRLDNKKLNDDFLLRWVRNAKS